jgi:prepilin-type processing-associated H-X9-DG protein
MLPGSPLVRIENSRAAQTILTALLCPSDATSGNGALGGRANVGAYTASDGTAINGVFGVSNYKGVAGGNWAWGSFTGLVCGTCVKWTGSNNGLDRGTGLICRNGDNQIGNMVRSRDVTDGTSNAFAVGEALPGRCNHSWWYWFNGATATCGVPLNHYAINTAITVGDWGNNYSFASLHTGGAHFAMVDGSVRFISENIDLPIYRGLASISGSEQVPSE